MACVDAVLLIARGCVHRSGMHACECAATPSAMLLYIQVQLSRQSQLVPAASDAAARSLKEASKSVLGSGRAGAAGEHRREQLQRGGAHRRVLRAAAGGARQDPGRQARRLARARQGAPCLGTKTLNSRLQGAKPYGCPARGELRHDLFAALWSQNLMCQTDSWHCNS